MKTVVIIIITLIFSTSAYCQSNILFDSETIIEVTAGADICADVITINGSYLGDGTQCNSPLPVVLTTFGAASAISVTGTVIVKLSWQTATEINSSRFEVERAFKSVIKGDKSGALIEFEKIGLINANGNSNSIKQYSFIDKNLPSGTYIYRLKMIDNDGSFKYSDEINVCIDKPSITDLKQNYPNCFNPATKIEYQLAATSRFKLELYNITGHLVSTLIEGEAEAGYYFYYLDMNKINNGLATGVYLYRMTVKDINSNTSKSFVKKLLFMK